jgi:hypothetical protein
VRTGIASWPTTAQESGTTTDTAENLAAGSGGAGNTATARPTDMRARKRASPITLELERVVCSAAVSSAAREPSRSPSVYSRADTDGQAPSSTITTSELTNSMKRRKFTDIQCSRAPTHCPDSIAPASPIERAART